MEGFMSLVETLTKAVKGGARKFGVEISRYNGPVIPCDQLLDQWVKRIGNERPVETVFDVGANHGRAVKWLRRCFPDATIYSFEPYEPAYQVLCSATSADPKVKTFCMALGERTGSATLHVNSNDVTNSLLPVSEGVTQFAPAEYCTPCGEVSVPLETIESFCAREGIPRIDVIKIDAQGYERQILKGAGALLAPELIRALFLELQFVEMYQGQAWGGELLELLREHHYRLFGLTNISYDGAQGWKWADAMIVGE
jgi:FkbM family methyltransferase